MESFKQGIKDGTIKRADAMRIAYADIHVRPGFNLRDVNAPDYEEDLQALEDHIGRGGQYPPLEVVPCGEGGVWLVDGHRRHAAIGRLIEKGQPIEFVPIVAFIGNDAAQVQRIITSQEGRKLQPLELAEGYRRLSAMGLTPDDIARRIGKTRQHVDQLLILANAPQAVQNMVASGQVSATLAMQMVRTHGEKAAHMLLEQLGQVKGAGKAKVTPKAMREWTPPAKMVQPLVDSVETLADSIPSEVRASLFWMESEHRLDSERVKIELPAAALWALLNQKADMDDARKAAAEKQREKAAKAAQGELVQEGGAA